jgi:Carbon dioxide concentrating mechanism/carboxysome shell protein
MQVVKIIGTVVSAKKSEGLQGVRLLVVQPVDSEFKAYGEPYVAVDAIGAGYGQIVCCSKSREGAMTLPNPDVCIDAGAAGIIDSVYCP